MNWETFNKRYLPAFKDATRFSLRMRAAADGYAVQLTIAPRVKGSAFPLQHYDWLADAAALASFRGMLTEALEASLGSRPIPSGDVTEWVDFGGTERFSVMAFISQVSKLPVEPGRLLFMFITDGGGVEYEMPVTWGSVRRLLVSLPKGGGR